MEGRNGHEALTPDQTWRTEHGTFGEEPDVPDSPAVIERPEPGAS